MWLSITGLTFLPDEIWLVFHRRCKKVLNLNWVWEIYSIRSIILGSKWRPTFLLGWNVGGDYLILLFLSISLSFLIVDLYWK